MKALAVIVALVVFGCGKETKQDKAKPAPEPKAVEVAPPAPEPTKRKQTTAGALGKTPAAPFGKIANAKLGMSEADAKAAVPELFTGKPLVDEENALSFTPVIEQGRLWRIEIRSTSLDNMERLASEAWGEGTKAKGTIGEVMYWWDPATNTRAIADSSDLDLAYYVPLAQLLGEPGKVAIAALPKPVLGVSPDQLRASYGPQMKPGDKLLHIYLPPTEWEREHVSVFVMNSDRKKKTTDYSILFSYKATPTAKDDLLAAFKTKWGEPKIKTSYGSRDPSFIFHKKQPLVQVDESTVDHAWRLGVRLKDDACGAPCFKGL